MADRNSFRYIILVVLFEIGYGLRFNLVGTISISELFAFVYTLIFIWSSKEARQGVFKYIFTLYVLLIITQCVSEIIVRNELANSLKGISVSVMSFCHFFFLFRLLSKKTQLIVWVLIGNILRIIIFPSAVEGDMSEALVGEDAAFLKFVLAPILINIALIYSIVVKTGKTYLIIISLGLFLVIVGARSSGLIVFLSGLVSYFVHYSPFRKIKNYRLLIIPLIIISYSMYCVYVNKVLSGEITSGNSVQLLETKHPYNPVNLLMFGRTETFVGAIAFMDKPLFGWGSWAEDPNGIYHLMAVRMADKNTIIERISYVIPSHSALIGIGMQNGIFAFIVMIWIYVFIIRKGFLFIRYNNRYAMTLIVFVIMFMWNMLFSPFSQFRFVTPMHMAFILVVYSKCKDMLAKIKYSERRLNLNCW